MNKTVNINLAGIFFHVDEDAYLKLQRYLEAIKRSFTDSQGRDEIISDIEARIAELFSEKIKDERQVISSKEVDEVIAVMGQPEDYRLDEEIFEDEADSSSYKSSTKSKQLFRDTTTSYVGGVSSGLGHFLGVDAIWIRLLWIILTFSSGGAFSLIYIAFWIFVPEANTTSDFLAMKGEAINISNIEKKIKEGFNEVADKVKDVDYQKYGNKVKSSSTTFFETLGSVILTLLNVIVKIIGVFLVFLSGITLLSIVVALVSAGIFGLIEAPFMEYVEVVNHPNIPVWLLLLLILFLVGIPFFFLMILGLKIISPNIKSLGTPTKLGLLAVWVLSFIGISILGISQATREAYDAEVLEEQIPLNLSASDTLTIRMVGNTRYIKNLRHRNNFKIKRDQNDKKILVFQDIEIYIKENSGETVPKMSIRKTAQGSSYEDAKLRAEEIRYEYDQKGAILLLNGYAITDYKNKYNDQEVEIILYIPEGMTIFADDNTAGYNNSWKYDDYMTINGKEGHYIQLINGDFICENCPKNDEWDDNDDESLKININSDEDTSNLKIDENGVKIRSEDGNVQIDENGVKIESDEINIKIDQDGVNIKTDN